MSQAAVWRETILGNGNRKCKGPGVDHQGDHCGWSEVSEGIWGLWRVNREPREEFELRRDKI